MQSLGSSVLHLDGTEHDLMAMARAFPQGAVLENMGAADLRLKFDNDCVKGMATSLGMHFGMRMSVSDFTGLAPISFGVAHEPMALEFAFCRGEGSRVISGDGETFDFGGGEYRVSRIRETTLFHYTADTGCVDRKIQISLTPATLGELLGTSALPNGIANLMEDPSPFRAIGAAMDPRMFSVTDEILECSSQPPSGVSQHLFLESKAMELVAILVDRMEENGQTLSRSDVDRVYRARELLRRSLPEPPTVTELARSVGMGERQFKASFKRVFGAPVMSYARRLRLERARWLLSERSFNVTQVAHEVGYANPSKFAAAYRKQFGVSPSARA